MEPQMAYLPRACLNAAVMSPRALRSPADTSSTIQWPRLDIYLKKAPGRFHGSAPGNSRLEPASDIDGVPDVGRTRHCHTAGDRDRIGWDGCYPDTAEILGLCQRRSETTIVRIREETAADLRRERHDFSIQARQVEGKRKPACIPFEPECRALLPE